jgi:hypothetical protein
MTAMKFGLQLASVACCMLGFTLVGCGKTPAPATGDTAKTAPTPAVETSKAAAAPAGESPAPAPVPAAVTPAPAPAAPSVAPAPVSAQPTEAPEALPPQVAAAKPAVDPKVSAVDPNRVETPKTHSGNLLSNGSFEAKSEDHIPEGWKIDPAAALVASPSKEKPYDGKEFVSIKGLKKNWSVLAHEFKLPDAAFGHKLHLSAFGKCPQEYNMVLALESYDGGTWTQKAKGVWPLSKKDWAEIGLDLTIPIEEKNRGFRVLVTVPNIPNLSYSIDSLALTYGLISNASVDNVDDDGRPLGWGIAGTKAKPNDSKVKPHDGPRYLAFDSSADSWAVAFVPLQISKEDLGKKLVVSAWGRSPEELFARMQVECKVGDVNKPLFDERACWWPASPDEWKQLIAAARIPADADPQSFRLVVNTRNKAGLTMLVDDLAATIE